MLPADNIPMHIFLKNKPIQTIKIFYIIYILPCTQNWQLNHNKSKNFA